MALVKPVVFQVIGYQNSGKTTLTTKLIKALKDRGLKTVTIKHHGHGGKPDAADQKDSSKHLSAGSIASIVEGDGRLILQAENFEISLEKQIELLNFFYPDVILIEGYKQENYPKLLLLRDKQDLILLEMVKNVTAVVYWMEEMREMIKANSNLPTFLIHDETAISWAVEFIMGLLKDK